MGPSNGSGRHQVGTGARLVNERQRRAEAALDRLPPRLAEPERDLDHVAGGERGDGGALGRRQGRREGHARGAAARLEHADWQREDGAARAHRRQRAVVERGAQRDGDVAAAPADGAHDGAELHARGAGVAEELRDDGVVTFADAADLVAVLGVGDFLLLGERAGAGARAGSAAWKPST